MEDGEREKYRERERGIYGLASSPWGSHSESPHDYMTTSQVPRSLFGATAPAAQHEKVRVCTSCWQHLQEAPGCDNFVDAQEDLGGQISESEYQEI